MIHWASVVSLQGNQFNDYLRRQRVLCALCLFVCLTFSRAASAASCFSIPTGAVGWWAAEGNANTLLGTNHGTLQGGATAGSPGMNGTAFSFDGTNGYVQIPDSALLRPTNLTIEAWVRFDSLDTPGLGGSPAGKQYMVFKQNSRSLSFEGYD